jgi:hypothetical protein
VLATAPFSVKVHAHISGVNLAIFVPALSGRRSGKAIARQIPNKAQLALGALVEISLPFSFLDGRVHISVLRTARCVTVAKKKVLLT